mmetsp:Transcript_12002/g.29092  ORF Transcript_12002/g.29092 Transcript_12002/m.29092 type:complete len:95 (-) Transcript_12002:13-297(-)
MVCLETRSSSTRISPDGILQPAVTDMNAVFRGATAFNQPLADWNTGAVTNLDAMFNLADNFNQDISRWDTSEVTHMISMFQAASAFNQPLADFL